MGARKKGKNGKCIPERSGKSEENRIYDCNARQDKMLVRLRDSVSKGWRLEQATGLEEDLERESKEGKESKAGGSSGRDTSRKGTEDEF